jgi:glycine cleavage system transcriptional repressor
MSRDTRNYLVLTAVGPDRPGLVNGISSLILGAGANLEDSRMAILGGEFALLVLISGAQAEVERVERELPALGEKLGLRVMLKHTRPDEVQRRFLPYSLRVTGVDRPGIVHGVSDLLARRGVNVASLDSRLAHAPLSGTPMFVLEAELQVPSELALSELRRELGALCDDENLDYVLEGSR